MRQPCVQTFRATLLWSCYKQSTKFTAHRRNLLNMTLISNDPSWWPAINISLLYSYSVVASYVVMVYDWVLTSGQEFELVWTRRWSLITVLYLSVRCLGVLYCVTDIMVNIPSILVTDAVGTIIWWVRDWMSVVTFVILGVVVIIRLHAMYQGSKKMLTFLVVTCLALTIAAGVTLAIGNHNIRGEEFIVSGNHHCVYYYLGGNFPPLLIGKDWIFVFGLAWEVLALCLAVWIVMKHYRELQPQSGWSVRDCFAVLIQTHVFYFGAFTVVSCLGLGTLSPNLSNVSLVGTEIYYGVDKIAFVVQFFILGPRLILSVRAHHAQLLANSDEGTAMTTIAFQERISESTDSDV